MIEVLEEIARVIAATSRGAGSWAGIGREGQGKG